MKKSGSALLCNRFVKLCNRREIYDSFIDNFGQNGIINEVKNEVQEECVSVLCDDHAVWY